MNKHFSICFAALCAMLFAAALPARSEIQLLAVASIPGDAIDLSGLDEKLSDGTPHNRFGAFGSAIAYAGTGNQYIVVPDRGPGDGAASYKCRFHTMEISIDEKKTLKWKLLATTLLTDEAGKNFVGATTAFDAKNPAASLRLDPEGARLGSKGTLFISDEYGPYVWEFDRSGKRIRSLTVPAKFLIANPSAKAKDELPPFNKSGRLPNKGMEGLAISPDGRKLFGIMQSPLIQDGGHDADGSRSGINNRLLEIDIGSGGTREFVYPLEKSKNGVCEIVALNEHQFLVLERDGKAGSEAKVKKIFRIDISGASDVSKVEALPANELPSSIKAVKKSLFIDLLDAKYGLAGPKLPGKIEGLAFGPDLSDGRRLLLVTTDNDLIGNAPSYIYAFAIDPADLPGYKPQQFEKTAVEERK